MTIDGYLPWPMSAALVPRLRMLPSCLCSFAKRWNAHAAAKVRRLQVSRRGSLPGFAAHNTDRPVAMAETGPLDRAPKVRDEGDAIQTCCV